MVAGQIGATAREVVERLEPMLQRTASKDEVVGLTTEVGRLATEVGRMNGTVRGLCEWRAEVKERHRQEDEHPAESKPADDPAPRKEWRETVNMVFGWALKFSILATVAAGLIKLPEIIELLK